eukprot:UN00220
MNGKRKSLVRDRVKTIIALESQKQETEKIAVNH